MERELPRSSIMEKELAHSSITIMEEELAHSSITIMEEELAHSSIMEEELAHSSIMAEKELAPLNIMEKELARLEKELARSEKELARSKKELAHPSIMEKELARPSIMEKPKKQRKKRCGGSRCSAGLPNLKSCTNISKMPGVSMHRFPKDPVFRRRWTQFVRRYRKGFNPSLFRDGPYVCSKHFEAHCFTRSVEDILPDFDTGSKKYLHRDAVPTIFDPLGKENKELSTRDRRMLIKEILSTHCQNKMEENSSGKVQLEEKPLISGGKLELHEGPSAEKRLKTDENMECFENLKSEKEGVE